MAANLVNNIASLKDHLKSHCVRTGKPFNGESLINTNQDVAIVHDLWNLDKHAELDRPSRSHLEPQLGELRRALALGEDGSLFSAPIESVWLNADGSSKKPEGKLKGGRGARHKINGPVKDASGNFIGNFFDICQRAFAEWIRELEAAGVTIEPITGANDNE